MKTNKKSNIDLSAQNNVAASRRKTYLFCKKDNSNTLLLCFSGRHAIAKFDFYKTFTEHPICNNIDVMFLGDAKGHFYLGGIQGFSSSFEETLINIKQLCVDNKYEKILFVGTSMGGFGSILHALCLAEMPNINCLVFNPYTIIPPQWLRDIKNSVDPQLMFYMLQRGISKEVIYKMTVGLDKRYIDLSLVVDTYLSRQNDTVKIHVIHGNVDKEMDMVNRLKKFNRLTSQVFDIKDHNIAGELSNLDRLYPILEKFILTS
jgi:predicted esterase YcpF (UPF0227 family)